MGCLGAVRRWGCLTVLLAQARAPLTPAPSEGAAPRIISPPGAGPDAGWRRAEALAAARFGATKEVSQLSRARLETLALVAPHAAPQETWTCFTL